MALDVGTPLRLDVGPPLQAIDKLLAADAAFRAETQKTSAVATTNYADMARASTAYYDSLKRQNDEVRAASAAVASAREELRRLNEEQKSLNAAQSKTNSTTAEYQRLNKELEKNRQAIVQVKAAIAESTQAVRDERTAVVAVQDARRQEANATKEVAAAAKDAAAAAKQEAAAEKEVAAAAKQAGAASQEAVGGASGATGGLLGVLGKIGGVLGGLALFGFAKRLGGEVLEVTADFQRMEAVLTTIFDGDAGKAERVFAQLRQFTLKNPFEVQSVTESYVKLRNVGINPSIQQFQQLADLAAASGKDIGAATDTLLGASTGRVAQLRQLGIVAKVNGDTIKATFRGITTEVENNQQAIASYVLGLGALDGVVGATARIMETTGGRVTNLKDNFTELFDTIGEGTGGPVNAFIRGLSEITKGINAAFKSDKQKISEAAAAPVQDYSDSVDALFKVAVERAKKNGSDANAAVAAVIKAQQATLAKELIEAQEQVDFFTLDGSKEASLRQGSYKGGAEQFKADGIQAKAYLEYVKAGQNALQERGAVALKEGKDEENSLGRIEALRAKIAADTKLRDQADDTKAGNAERVRLNALLKDEGKLLDELLGKEEKVRKARQYSYESQLRALLNERQMLTGLAAKAGAKQADDAAAQAKLVFEESLRQVDVIKAKLEQRELDLRKAAAKVGGGAVARLGEKADGVVDGAQEKAIQQLRLAALDQYYESLYKITVAREQRLFELRNDSDAKQIEAIDRKYDALIKANTDGIEREAIEEARQREQLALKAQQEQRRIDQTASLGAATAQAVGQVYGAGTGVSVFEAKRAEAKALLDIEKKAAEDSLNNTLNKTGKEAEIEREALRGQLGRIAQQQKKLAIEESLSKFSIYKLILGENDSEETRAALDKVASTVVSALGDIVDAEEKAAAARVETANQNINELTGQLAAEIELHQAGSASNIKGIQDQIAAEKQARQQALEAQRTAAKEKVLLDTLTQASSIATAAAEVFATFAPIPFIGIPLGIAAAALLVGAFTAAKVQAYQAAGSTGYFKGGYTGGNDEREERGVVHGKEFVHTAEKTELYRDSLFEPLHLGRPQDIDWSTPQMQAILPDLELPGKLRAERAESVRVQHEHTFGSMKQDFDRLHTRLEAIEGSNREMADRAELLRLSDTKYVTRTANGSEFIRNV